MPHPQEEYETDMSNTFAVTTPYVDAPRAGYFETQGALEFSPNSAVDPKASTKLPLAPRLQQRRQTFHTPPRWKAVPRGVRSASARPSAGESGGPNGRPGVQASKQRSQHQPDIHQVVGPDYDEVLGVRDDSDAEARMQRLLNQLESVTQLDNRNTHEGDWTSSSSTGHSQAPPSYENAQRPSTLTSRAFARQLEDPTTPRYPAPLHENERVLSQDGGGIDYYTEAGSRLSTSDHIPKFPNPPQNIARSPLPRHKSTSSIPNTIAIAPQPSRSPPRSATAGTEANHAQGRKPTLFRSRYGGSDQSLHDLSKQNARPAQLGPGYGQHSNHGGNPFLNPLITPASPGTMLPGLISDSVSRSSSLTSIQTRLVTPTDSIAPAVSGAHHALGRIDEKSSMDYNELEDAKKREAVLFMTPSHTSHTPSGAQERENMMRKTPGVKLTTPSPSSAWSGELASGRHVRSVTTTPSTSVFDIESTMGGSSIGGGPGGLGSLHRSYSRGGGSDISSFTDGLSRTSAGRTNSMNERTSPTVAAATSFAMSGTMPTGVPLSKAERAAEKARQKAERAARKAETALLKVEREREAKAQLEETKRAATEIKKEAKKREKEERQRQTDLNMTRLVLFST